MKRLRIFPIVDPEARFSPKGVFHETSNYIESQQGNDSAEQS